MLSEIPPTVTVRLPTYCLDRPELAPALAARHRSLSFGGSSLASPVTAASARRPADGVRVPPPPLDGGGGTLTPDAMTSSFSPGWCGARVADALDPGKGSSGAWLAGAWLAGGWHGVRAHRTGLYQIGLGAAVPAVAAGVELAGVPQVPPVEIGPERVEKHQFRIGGLPEQEVRKALLARGSDEKVDLGNRRLVQLAGEHLFVDLTWPDLPRDRVRGDSGGRVGDLGPASVVDAELQGQHGIPGRHLLGLLKLADHTAP